MGRWIRPAMACLLAAGTATAFVRTPSPLVQQGSLVLPRSSALSSRRTAPTAVLGTALGWRFGKRGLVTPPSTALASAAAAAGGEKKKLTPFEIYEKTSEFIVNLFPIWTLLFSAIALKNPSAFSWLTVNYFTAGLGLLMLSMGITLSPKDFADVLQRPAAVIIGFLACYGLMPALAFVLAGAFGLSPDLTAGLVLVGSINGGQVSGSAISPLPTSMHRTSFLSTSIPREVGTGNGWSSHGVFRALSVSCVGSFRPRTCARTSLRATWRCR